MFPLIYMQVCIHSLPYEFTNKLFVRAAWVYEDGTRPYHQLKLLVLVPQGLLTL